MTREEFEASEVKMHPVDGMNYKPAAQPDCKTCRGMGIVDAGELTGCILVICPDCWRKR